MHLFSTRGGIFSGDELKQQNRGMVYKGILRILTWISGSDISSILGGSPLGSNCSYIVSPNNPTCGTFCSYEKNASNMSSIVGMQQCLSDAKESEIGSQIIKIKSSAKMGDGNSRRCAVDVICQRCGKLARSVFNIEKQISGFSPVIPSKGFDGSLFRLGTDENKVMTAEFKGTRYLVSSISDSNADRFMGKSYVFTKLSHNKSKNTYSISSADTRKLGDIDGDVSIAYGETDSRRISGLELPKISTVQSTLGL